VNRGRDEYSAAAEHARSKFSLPRSHSNIILPSPFSLMKFTKSLIPPGSETSIITAQASPESRHWVPILSTHSSIFYKWAIYGQVAVFIYSPILKLKVYLEKSAYRF